jgi:hypothetical protein
MSEGDLVGDFADPGFQPLGSGGDEGAAELARSGRVFGVVTDSEGIPLQLYTSAGLAPFVAIEADEPMRRVLGEDVISLVDSGVPGLVVVRDAHVTGVLSAQVIYDFAAAQPTLRGGGTGDWQLHGDAPVKKLTLTCSTCGTKNEVVYFLDGQTQCVNGHLLTVRWR